MKSDAIERRATSKVTNLIARCEHLTPHIAEGDKEPEWDGNIYFKAGDSFKRIPVQIKGKECKKKLPNKKTYQVSVSSLKSYLHDGGIVYFVVYLLGDDDIPYYATLAPVDLKRFIKQATGQASIAIPLHRLPDNLEEFEDGMKMFELACKMQVSFEDNPNITLDEAIKRYGNISFTAASFGSKEVAEQNSHKMHMYLYSTISEGDQTIKIPIGDQSYRINVGRNIGLPVCIAGEKYFDGVTYYKEEENQTFVFGEELGFSIPNKGTENNHREISIRTSMLDKRLNILKFLRAITLYKEINLGDKCTLHFENAKLEKSKSLDNEIESLERIRRTFDALGYHCDIDMSSLSDEHLSRVRTLSNCLLDGALFKHPAKESTFLEVSLGDKNFLLFMAKQKSGKLRLMTANQFDHGHFITYEADNGQQYPTSVFTLLLNKLDFTRFVNIDYKSITYSYEELLDHNPEIFARANNDILSGLMEYDKMEIKDSALIQGMQTLCEWIIDKSEENNPIYEINRNQILKRQRELSKKEKHKLCRMLQTNIPKDQQIAIHLLLDNHTHAEMLFEEMPEAQQKFFRSLPIYHFMEQS